MNPRTEWILRRSDELQEEDLERGRRIMTYLHYILTAEDEWEERFGDR